MPASSKPTSIRPANKSVSADEDQVYRLDDAESPSPPYQESLAQQIPHHTDEEWAAEMQRQIWQHTLIIAIPAALACFFLGNHFGQTRASRAPLQAESRIRELEEKLATLTVDATNPARTSPIEGQPTLTTQRQDATMQAITQQFQSMADRFETLQSTLNRDQADRLRMQRLLDQLVQRDLQAGHRHAPETSTPAPVTDSISNNRPSSPLSAMSFDPAEPTLAISANQTTPEPFGLPEIRHSVSASDWSTTPITRVGEGTAMTPAPLQPSPRRKSPATFLTPRSPRPESRPTY